MVRELEFGIQPPKGVLAAWGARAIYRPLSEDNMIDFVAGRSDMDGPKKDLLALTTWLEEKGLPELRKRLDDEGIGADSRETVTIQEKPFTLKASPRGSYGYLYLGGWMKGKSGIRQWRPAIKGAEESGDFMDHLEEDYYPRRAALPTPKYMVLVGPEESGLTPDDLVIEPAETEKDVEALWDLHDGRNLGTMVVAVYRRTEEGDYVRDSSWGILGSPGKTGHADPEKDTI